MKRQRLAMQLEASQSGSSIVRPRGFLAFYSQPVASISECSLTELKASSPHISNGPKHHILTVKLTRVVRGLVLCLLEGSKNPPQ